MRYPILALLAACLWTAAPAAQTAPTLPVKPDITVAADGSGNFKTVQEAVASIPKDNRDRVIVYVKNGTYNEKIRVDANYVTLFGESRAGTRIEFAQPNNPGGGRGGRGAPAAAQGGRAGGGGDAQGQAPAAGRQGQGRGRGQGDNLGQGVVNVNGDDFVLQNITVENTNPTMGVHAFAIYGRGDRTVLMDANVWSIGNDTIALWRTANGQFSEDASNHSSPNGRYYHARLDVRGSVDFICPRGWCYITDSDIFEVNPDTDAAMWHDGSRDKDMKFVMTNCRFDGVPTFRLARHHHDGMLFFINCTFPTTMRDNAPYRVIYPLNGGPPSPADIQNNKDHDPTNIWGERDYYFNSPRAGGNYAWHKDNLEKAPGSPKPEQITAKWTFAGKWDPENKMGPTVSKIAPGSSGQIAVTFSEAVTVKGKPRLALRGGAFADYVSGSGSDILLFAAPAGSSGAVDKIDLQGGAIIAIEAAATLRLASLKLP